MNTSENTHMTIVKFRDHKIVPVSYQNVDTPRHWYPKVDVVSPNGETTSVVLHPARGITKEEADGAAIAEAKRRIAANNL